MSENQKVATRVVTGPVRLAFAHLFEPYSNNDNAPKYSCALLIPKDDKTTIAALQTARAAAVEAKFGANPPKNLKSTIKDGDQYEGDNDEFKGMLVLNISSKYQPGIVDRKLQPILDSTEVYSGCYVRASVNCYAYDHPTGGKGVSFGLNHVMKWEDGDFLGGRSRAEDDFADLVDLSTESTSTASDDLAGLL